MKTLFMPDVLTEAVALCESEKHRGYKVFLFVSALLQPGWLAALTTNSELRVNVFPTTLPLQSRADWLAERLTAIEVLICAPDLACVGLRFPGFEAGLFSSTENYSHPVITQCVQRVRLNTPVERQARIYFPVHTLNGVAGFSQAAYSGLRRPDESPIDAACRLRRVRLGGAGIV